MLKRLAEQRRKFELLLRPDKSSSITLPLQSVETPIHFPDGSDDNQFSLLLN